ncbi:synaptosomal-associated protein 23-like [Rhinichthys klamathensis goyatoka]|uniref:synaptosomal-associated protein 23-like n=1 Tax=Rhinichthys klamathensis goyatoka TaxID=3034132 RepID=UPI0024B5CFF7|nr:synaptosomal-associated protein 23-like [Rhinichthys klamathensis goyatoka]
MADMSVDEITSKANRVTDESADSCRRILQMTEETMNVGDKTITMLDEQEEKLRNVKQEVGQIKQDMKQARKNLNELSKCCGLCLCPWNRVKSSKSDRRYKQGKEPKESKRNVVSSQKSAIRNGTEAPSGPYINRITNDEREDEMEENLKIVGSNILIMKSMALGIGDKISKQIQTIDEINNEVTKNTHDVIEAEKHARKHH